MRLRGACLKAVRLLRARVDAPFVTLAGSSIVSAFAS